MPEINQIFDANEAKKILDVNKAISTTDTTLIKFSENVLKLSATLKESGISFEKINEVQKKTVTQNKELDAIAKQVEKSEQKLKDIEKGRYDQLIKNKKAITEINRVKKDEVILNDKEAGTLEKLAAANRKLQAEKKKLNLETKEGQKRLIEINKEQDNNNKIIKESSNQLEKQKINIGNYKNDIIDAAKETKIFGVSINDVVGKLTSAAGIITGVTAVILGLGKAYASSARGAEDLARASDRLKSISKSLGNTLADATGDVGFFDAIVRGLQQQFLGLASTIDSDVQVAILSQIRQLEILEQDQERQKKAQLDRAEQLRQIRDEERNSLEERKAANDELGKIISERESETIKYQEKKLALYQTLLKYDEGNIEIQTAIKQIEFEIADAREEAQGFRSEQLVNDLALSREYYANEVELQKLIIENEIKKNGETYALRKKLIDLTHDLEVKAAGRNQQLIEIANEKYKSAMIDLSNSVIDIKKNEINKIQSLESEKIESTKQNIELETEKLNKQNDERIEKLNEQAEEDEERLLQRLETTKQITSEIGQLTEAFATGQIKSFKEFSKEILLLGLEVVKRELVLTRVQILAKELASKGFGGLITAGLLYAAVEVAFAGAKAAIQGFEHGTDSAPSEFIAGESGRELMSLKTGEVMMVDKPTHFKGQKFKGATIFSNPETEKIIRQTNNNQYVFDTKELKDEMRSVRKAIERKPVNITDRSGRVIGRAGKNYREYYVNRLKNGR